MACGNLNSSTPSRKEDYLPRVTTCHTNKTNTKNPKSSGIFDHHCTHPNENKIQMRIRNFLLSKFPERKAENAKETENKILA